MQVLQPQQHTRGVKDCPRFAEHLIVNVHHKIATAGVLHHKAHVLRRLKAGKEVHEKGMAHLGGRFKDPLLRKQTLHLVAGNNVAFL